MDRVKDHNSQPYPVVLCHQIRDDHALQSSKGNSKMVVVVVCITCLVLLEEEEEGVLVELGER